MHCAPTCRKLAATGPWNPSGAYFDKATALGDRPALIVRQQEVRWSYGEFKERIDAFAAGLLALGIAPGDRAASGRRTVPNGW